LGSASERVSTQGERRLIYYSLLHRNVLRRKQVLNKRKKRSKEESKRKVKEARAKKMAGYYDRLMPIIIDPAVDRLMEELLGEKERAA